MAVQRGVITSQNIPMSGRSFHLEEDPPPCFRDRWGEWTCGHDHGASVPLEDAYQYFEGWTAQSRL